jgi:hypothetical protein
LATGKKCRTEISHFLKLSFFSKLNLVLGEEITGEEFADKDFFYEELPSEESEKLCNEEFSVQELLRRIVS